MKSFSILILFVSSFSFAANLKVGISPALSSAGIYLAAENGFFKDEGLDVELVTIANSGASMTLLLSKGELDVGAGNLSSGLFNAIGSGQNFKLVADKGHSAKDCEYIALVVRKDLIDSGKFKTLKDLKGMKLGLTALDGVSQQIVADKMLQSVGLSEKDVTYVKLSYPEMNTALKAKTLDATIQLEPYLTSGLEDGIFKIVEHSQKYVPDQQSAAVFYSPQMLKEKKDLGVKFMVAYLRGIRLYNAGLKDSKIKEKVFTSLKKYIQVSKDELWGKMIPVGLRDDGLLDSKKMMEDLKWYKSKGYVTSEIKEDQLIDNSFVTEAAKILAKKKE